MEECIFNLLSDSLSPSIALCCAEVSYFNLILYISNVKCCAISWYEICLCSSCSHIWDAFQLAKASFQLYCVRNNYVLPADGPKVNGKLGPRLLGDAPKINIAPPEKVMGEGEEEENSSDGLPAIQIYSDDVDMSFLVCGVPCTLVLLKHPTPTVLSLYFLTV